ncbi:MAG: protein translocase subunit SecF, partial [Oscillospiraceae bacterium]|nr:protein translocase subunit SecF [Oscillospiraceae bacterium]
QSRARVCLLISAGIMLLALILTLCGYGLNMGIDFTGGIILKYEMGQAFDVNDITDALAAENLTSVSVAKTGEAQTEAQIRTPDVGEQSDEMRASFEAALSEKYPNMRYISVERVGAVAGRSLIDNAINSVLLAWALMLIYIAIRFDFFSGVAAVLGILHDVLMMLSLMVLLRSFIQINSTFIAAMLTIVGYSINNTIVIFDRIRENLRKSSLRGVPRSEVVTQSVKESLTRTVNTTLTTLITTVLLFALGVDSVKEFSLPLIAGMLSGIYSSNLINGYVWGYLLENQHIFRRQFKGKKA